MLKWNSYKLSEILDRTPDLLFGLLVYIIYWKYPLYSHYSEMGVYLRTICRQSLIDKSFDSTVITSLPLRETVNPLINKYSWYIMIFLILT